MGTSFFYWFQGVVIYWWIIKIPEGVEISKKRENPVSRGGESFFLFYQSELLSGFVPVVPVSPDTHCIKGEMPRIKLKKRSFS